LARTSNCSSLRHVHTHTPVHDCFFCLLLLERDAKNAKPRDPSCEEADLGVRMNPNQRTTNTRSGGSRQWAKPALKCSPFSERCNSSGSYRMNQIFSRQSGRSTGAGAPVADGQPACCSSGGWIDSGLQNSGKRLEDWLIRRCCKLRGCEE
jgi:hypothetical protein